MSKLGYSPDIQSTASARRPAVHSIFAIVAIAALGFAQPALASASVSGATDMSAARRQHVVHHNAMRRDEPNIRSLRNSMNFVATPQGSEGYGYGYGYGDNSRNQTW